QAEVFSNTYKRAFLDQSPTADTGDDEITDEAEARSTILGRLTTSADVVGVGALLGTLGEVTLHNQTTHGFFVGGYGVCAAVYQLAAQHGRATSQFLPNTGV